MNFLKMALVTAVFFIFSVVMGANAADIEKIGVVDFQKIVENSTAGKLAQAEFKKKGDDMKADLMKRGAEIEELKKKIEVDAMVMTQEKREEKEREFRIKLNDFKMAQKKYEDDFKRIQSQLFGKIRNDLIEIINDYGSKEGYTLIVEKAAAVYSPISKDITDQIIPLYNKKTENQ